MPPVAVAIGAIVSAIATSISVGESLFNQPSAPKAATPTPAQTNAAAATQKQNQLTALTQQTPNIQANTGGSLSPEAWAQLADVLSGQAGNTGIGAANTDLVTKLLTGNTGGGGVSAGAGSGTTPGTPSSGLTNTTFG